MKRMSIFIFGTFFATLPTLGAHIDNDAFAKEMRNLIDELEAEAGNAHPVAIPNPVNRLYDENIPQQENPQAYGLVGNQTVRSQ